LTYRQNEAATGRVVDHQLSMYGYFCVTSFSLFSAGKIILNHQLWTQVFQYPDFHCQLGNFSLAVGVEQKHHHHHHDHDHDHDPCSRYFCGF
jgi:hypothetical protein